MIPCNQAAMKKNSFVEMRSDCGALKGFEMIALEGPGVANETRARFRRLGCWVRGGDYYRYTRGL